MKKIVLLLSLLVYLSCNSNPVTPEYVKDPRDYIWTIDTIKYEDTTIIQSLLSSIWGSSEKDVYATGHTDSGDKIMHYDGISWKEINIRKYGIIETEIEAVTGLSANDVWVSGQTQIFTGEKPNLWGSAFHFNGTKWELFNIQAETFFIGIWGCSPNNIWLSGDRGVVAHYDGINLTADTIKIAAGSDASFYVYKIVEHNNIIHSVSFKYPYYYWHKKINDNWIVVDSFYADSQKKWGNSNLYITLDNKLYSYGDYGVWELNGDSWDKIITTQSTVTGITEYTRGKFIIADFFGKVYDSSYSNSTLIKDFGSGFELVAAWANNKECFIVANIAGGGIASKTVVLHGK